MAEAAAMSEKSNRNWQAWRKPSAISFEAYLKAKSLLAKAARKRLRRNGQLSLKRHRAKSGGAILQAAASKRSLAKKRRESRRRFRRLNLWRRQHHQRISAAAYRRNLWRNIAGQSASAAAKTPSGWLNVQRRMPGLGIGNAEKHQCGENVALAGENCQRKLALNVAGANRQ
jgi:hypothetical protein